METQKTKLTTQEAAKYLRLSLSWIYRLVAQNEIPFHQRPGKHEHLGVGRRNCNLWFDRAELDTWNDSGKNNVEKEI